MTGRQNSRPSHAGQGAPAESSEYIQVPALYCPVASRKSDLAEQLDAGSVAWMNRLGLFEDAAQQAYLTKGKFGHFPAATMPYGNRDALQLAGDQLFWLFTFDDRYCDERPGSTPPDELIVLLAGLARITENPHCALVDANPWAEGLRDLRIRVAEQATPVQLARWEETIHQYFFGLMRESVNRAGTQVPGLDDYITMWLNSSAVTPGLFFIELAGGFELSAAEFADPRVRALREMVVALVGWDNDITSYNKELYRAMHYGYPNLQNLITVLAQQHAWPAERALAEAIAMRDQVIELFLHLRAHMRTEAGENLCRYLDGLAQWVRGYLDWSSHTPRYADPHTPADHATAQHSFTLTAPTETKTSPPCGPLPISTIAYWWELLPAPVGQTCS